METPDHTNWEPTRHPTYPEKAKQHLSELKRWVRDTISSLGTETFADEVNVEGLSHLLDFDGAAVGNNSTQVETLDSHAPTENFSQDLLPTNNVPPKILTTVTDDSDDDFGDDTRRTPGDVTDTGNLPAIRTLGGNRHRKTRDDTHTGNKNPDGRDTILSPVAGKPFACDKVRVIKIGDKKYRLIVRVDRNISHGRIEIFAVGENGTREKLSVTQTRAENPNVQLLTVGDNIKFVNLRGGVEAKISFELRSTKNYALGVAVYEA